MFARLATPPRATLLVALVVAATAWAQQPAPNDLGAYVPGDVWVYVRAKNTPSREFLIPHWNRVFRGIQNSGIDQEFSRLISANLPPEGRAEFDRTWADISASFRKVAWLELMGDDVVFAQRFGGMMPEFFLLGRPAPATRDANIAALGRLMEQLSALSEGSAAYRHELRDGVDIHLVEGVSAPIGVYLFHKDGILGMTFGKLALEDSIALLNGKSAKPCIENNPRFRAAMKDVPPAEFVTSFFDVHRYFSVLATLPDMMLQDRSSATANELASTNGVATVREVMRSVIDHFDFIDYVISSGHMEGRREVTHTVTRLRPEALGKPCCRMLTQRQPFTEVHRYIPVEATGFSATGFFDPALLYRTVLDVMRTDIPNGEELCQRWATLQDEWDFDVEDDLLSWISGEMISIDLPCSGPNPYGEGDSVLLVRVKDPVKALARVKSGVDRLATFLTSKGQALVVQPPDLLPKDQFVRVNHAITMMMGMQPCVGVWQDWLVLGSREQPVQAVLDTAAGKHPSFQDNARYRAEGLKPDGAVSDASFTDLSNLGQELSQFFIGLGFAAAVMPDEPETRMIKAIINSLGRLGPVVAEINFYSSSSKLTTYSDGVFRTTQVVTYKSPPDRPQ